MRDKVAQHLKISNSIIQKASKEGEMTKGLLVKIRETLKAGDEASFLILLAPPIGNDGGKPIEDRSIQDYFQKREIEANRLQSGEPRGDRDTLIEDFRALEELKSITKEVASFSKSASSALLDDNYPKARRLARQAIEDQIKHKLLDDACVLSNLMSLHGRADLLADDVDSAVETFVSAGAMLSHFSRYEAGRFLTYSGRFCFHHGQSHGGSALLQSLGIYSQANGSLVESDDLKDWARLKNYTGETYRVLGRRNEDSKSQDWFDCAKKEYESALAIFENEHLEYEAAKVTCNLALLLKYRGGIEDVTDGVTHLDAARTMFEKTLGIPEIKNDELRTAKIHHYLGNTYAEWGIRSSGLDRDRRFNSSIRYFEKALKVYISQGGGKRRANTQNNLANALIESTVERHDNDEVTKLYKAKQLCMDALKARLKKRAPLEWAQTTTNLANTLLQLSKREKGMRDKHLGEAKFKCENAANIRLDKKVPMDWVESAFLEGEIAEEIFKDTRVDIISFVTKEEQRYTEILEVLDGMNIPYYAQKAEQCLEHLKSYAN